MDEIIKIKCPFCGAILSVKNQPGIENKNVTCPVCKKTYLFKEYKRVVQNPSHKEDVDTEYPGAAKQEEKTVYPNNEKPTVLPDTNYTLGKLKVEGMTTTFQLHLGRNVIGRKSVKSQSDFQIDTAEKRGMSREHLLIEVKKVPGKGFVHYVSLYKERVNKTFVGDELLAYGDVLILHHGDVIKLPDATLKFEIPDDELTDRLY